jgi:hypothetical protein
MSQEKVDRYKEEKANRKKIMKQEKRKRIAVRTVAVVICVGIVGLIGYSGYQNYEKSQPRESYEVNYTSIDDYLSALEGAD